jgi:hypothetical protein
MSVAGVAAGVGAAAAAASAGMQMSKGSGGSGGASSASSAGSAEAMQALVQSAQQARRDLQPYADVGGSALKQLAWSMGLDQPGSPKPATPKTWQPGQSNDPVWEKLLSQFNQALTARSGKPMDRSWDSDETAKSIYNNLAQQYQAIKAKEAKTPYAGQGDKGWLMEQFGDEQYKNDPGYTPFVNTLEDLQQTPGYQFRLQQGLDSTNNSAAARGSLLSGGQLKSLNNYASGFASTEYQNAWDRAQQAYQNAFSRDTQNKNNTFSKLQSMTNNGQSAATQQGNYSMDVGKSVAGVSSQNAANQASLALYNGQNQQAALNQGVNAVTGLLSNPSVQNGISGLFGGGSGTVNTAGLNNQISNYLGWRG